MLKLLDNCRYLGPDFELHEGRILVEDALIAAVLAPGQAPATPPNLVLDLEGRLVFPGLINAHDHLYGTFHPKSVNGPYRNWFEWEQDYKTSPVYKQKQQLSIADLYALGMYRNLMSGCTVVMDHFPHEVNNTFYGRPSISLVEQYTLAHSVSSRRLDWGKGISEEFALAKGGKPFVLHIEEGFDQEIQEEVENLNRMGGLAENTVLVHGISLNDMDIELIARVGAKIVWCPASNMAMYQTTAPLARLLDAGILVTLGTDSPMTGSLNLFEELRFAYLWSQENLRGRLVARDLLAMVTIKAAQALGLAATHGAIEVGKRADVVVFKDRRSDYWASFMDLTPKDLDMVIHDGVLVYGDEIFRSICPVDFDSFSEVLVDGRPKVVWGKPLELLERIEYKLGQPKQFPFMPVTSP